MSPFTTPSGLTFKSAAAAQRHAKAIKDRYQIGESLNAQDRADIVAFARHHADDKRPDDVNDIIIRVPPGRPPTAAGLHLVYADGTVDDCSYKYFFKPGQRHEVQVKRALRDLIEPQIVEFREAMRKQADIEGRVACAITGVPTPIGEMHIDHKPPKTFDALVAGFLSELGLTFADIPISAPAANQATVTILDEAVHIDFDTYHRENCVLQITSKGANLSQGAGR